MKCKSSGDQGDVRDGKLSHVHALNHVKVDVHCSYSFDEILVTLSRRVASCSYFDKICPSTCNICANHDQDSDSERSRNAETHFTARSQKNILFE